MVGKRFALTIAGYISSTVIGTTPHIFGPCISLTYKSVAAYTHPVKSNALSKNIKKNDHENRQAENDP
jgi:hypothetical protein